MYSVDKINWFPGHMKKATTNVLESVKNVDLVIEVVDSRAINLSSIASELKINKPILRVALKSDLCDTKTLDKSGVLIGSILDKSFYTTIINKINNCLGEKRERLVKKGLVNPIFYVMVVGLPNVGKSSLINFLARKNLVTAKNMAGVTKKQNTLKISDNLYVQDNPGIMFKNIVDINVGYKLALAHCIKKEILPIHDVCEFAYNFFMNNYTEAMVDKFSIVDTSMPFDSFIEFVSLKNNYIISQNKIDYDRFYNYFFNECTNGEICKVNYEIDNE